MNVSLSPPWGKQHAWVPLPVAGGFHRQSVFGLASCWLGFCSFLGLFYAVSSSPHDFVFTASDDLLTCSKNVAVKVSFVFVVWKETCK